MPKEPKIERRQSIYAKILSRCLKRLNKSNKGYFNGNIAKHRFLNEIQVMAASYPGNKAQNQESILHIAGLILHHLENEWVTAENWNAGAESVWGIVRTIEYPRGDYDGRSLAQKRH